jgi:hypothetical protein
VIFLRAALVIAAGLIGGGGPTKSLNDFSRGWGDVWYDLESGHQGVGIGGLGNVRTHHFRDISAATFHRFLVLKCESGAQSFRKICV